MRKEEVRFLMLKEIQISRAPEVKKDLLTVVQRNASCQAVSGGTRRRTVYLRKHLSKIGGTVRALTGCSTWHFSALAELRLANGASRHRHAKLATWTVRQLEGTGADGSTSGHRYDGPPPALKEISGALGRFGKALGGPGTYIGGNNS